MAAETAAAKSPGAARPLTIGLLAGESSGDHLGAGLMAELRREVADVRFVGVGGERMQEQGLECWLPLDAFNMHGFVEPLRRAPRLLGHLRALTRRFVEAEIDLFVGIDFNVFNLMLERRLKQRGFRTVHYVSPSVYAWRRGRIKRMARSADRLLTLFPFEPAFYRHTPVDAVYVGHPLADAIPPDADPEARRQAARQELGLAAEGFVLALLPGSRSSEIGLMAPVFLQAARRFGQGRGPVQILVPCPRPALGSQLAGILDQYADLNVQCYDGDARSALSAADAALVKSGTSTLEAMLLGCPMVVSYRLEPLTYQIVRRLVRTPHVALPNILAGKELVPELLQNEATPERLAKALEKLLQRVAADAGYLESFRRMHGELRCNANQRAARAVLEMIPDDSVTMRRT